VSSLHATDSVSRHIFPSLFLCRCFSRRGLNSAFRYSTLHSLGAFDSAIDTRYSATMNFPAEMPPSYTFSSNRVQHNENQVCVFHLAHAFIRNVARVVIINCSVVGVMAALGIDLQFDFKVSFPALLLRRTLTAQCVVGIPHATARLPGTCSVSHLTPHTSHLTPHTSHLTPHTSHLTPHT
jgi:hypothetical protein